MHYSAEVRFAEPLVEVGTFSCFKVKGNKSDGEQVLEKCFSQLIKLMLYRLDTLLRSRLDIQETHHVKLANCNQTSNTYVYVLPWIFAR